MDPSSGCGVGVDLAEPWRRLLITLRDSRRGNSRLRGLKAREFGGGGVIESMKMQGSLDKSIDRSIDRFSSDGGSIDFRGADCI